MKKLSILVFAFIAFTMLSCKEDATAKIKEENLKNAKTRNIANNVDAPVMTFEKTEHDWGNVVEGDKLETIFKFKNTGQSELIITNIKASCGCTVPKDWKKEPIMPGEESEFTVQFDTKNRPNKQSKTITISSNTNTGKETVKIKATVEPDPEQEKIRAEKKKKNADRAAKRKIEQAKETNKQ
ncbi:MAG: DUF1573 domain-containing protein [Flavobacteriaceae bacterium]|nr:DUF1573 domain-containing protein [Flavobacteriaceae bacterium]